MLIWGGLQNHIYPPHRGWRPPTRLPGDNHRSGSSTLLRPPSVTRHPLGGIVPKDSPHVTDLGLDAYTVVLEYQPVVHRLRLAASS